MPRLIQLPSFTPQNRISYILPPSFSVTGGDQKNYTISLFSVQCSWFLETVVHRLDREANIYHINVRPDINTPVYQDKKN